VNIEGKDINAHLDCHDYRDTSISSDTRLIRDVTITSVSFPTETFNLITCLELQNTLCTMINKMNTKQELATVANTYMASMNIKPGWMWNRILHDTVELVWYERSGFFDKYAEEVLTTEGNRNRKLKQAIATKRFAARILNSYDVENWRFSTIIMNLFSFCAMVSANIGKKDF